jgi:hypothetical protein
MFALPGIRPDDISSTAGSINNRGQIVGTTIESTSSSGVATLWQNNTAFDLNALVRDDDPLKPYVILQSTSFINNRGEILAGGVDSRGSPFEGAAYLLTPTE